MICQQKFAHRALRFFDFFKDDDAVGAAADGFSRVPVLAPGVTALQRSMLWLIGIGSAIVFIEPSPYELVTLASLIIFAATGEGDVNDGMSTQSKQGVGFLRRR